MTEQLYSAVREIVDDASTATQTFYWDRSQWQGVIPVSAFGAVECYRVDTGSSTDPDFAATYANAKAAHAKGTLKVLILYVVHLTGHEAQIAARVRAAMGGACPNWVCFMVDEESGSGFDGPGNHSAGANLMVELLYGFTKRGIKSICGYANAPDWASNWASRLSGLKRMVARYSDSAPPAGWYGWQYWGGVQNSHPNGYPAPIGSDMNMIPLSVAQIELDFAVVIPAPPKPPTPVTGEIMWMLYGPVKGGPHILAVNGGVMLYGPKAGGDHLLSLGPVRAIGAEADEAYALNECAAKKVAITNAGTWARIVAFADDAVIEACVVGIASAQDEKNALNEGLAHKMSITNPATWAAFEAAARITL